MKRILLLCFALVTLISFNVLAQKTVSGKVTDENGEALPGVNVLIKGTTTGAQTDLDGNFRLAVNDGATLVFSYVGFETQEIAVGSRTTIDVTMGGATELQEVVVTALGIDREKASLGYATQEVGGDEVSKVKDVNFMNSLSGKVAGLQIKRSNQMGGSTNVIIRGYSSLTSDNQALFVVDGVIVNNSINNSSNQQTGRGGYDYGNAAMDINPDDIASINVLKGAAATALYGSRAANGVVVITTKKGAQNDALGVNVSFGTTFGKIDKSTFVKYQDEYGAGYSEIQGWYADGGYDYYDFGGGQERITPTYEDASYGAPLDGTLAYDWRSLYPELDTYGQLFPHTATDNDATTFYETSVMLNTNVSIQGGTDKANYRLSYTNVDQKGVLPNSELKRNTLSFGGGYNVTDKFKVSSTINYTFNEAVGRFGTGYDNRNPNQSFRQWYQVTTDMSDQKAAYEQTGLNISWNPYGALDTSNPTAPHYFDNYYFNRYENFNSDERNRVYGNFKVDYQFTEWLTFTGRFATDRYSELREERIAVGSVDVSSYYRENRTFLENNTDLFLNFNKYLNDNMFSIGGLLGANFRRTKLDVISAQTNGGLVTPGTYSLSNSVSSPEAPTEAHTEVGVNGYFAQVNFGYNEMLYLDITGRQDISSTLPEDNNSYFYPGASLSFIFSEVANPGNIFDMGKVRVNYAEVGNGAGALLVSDIFLLNTPMNGTPLATASTLRRNENLKPERTKSWEVGLETSLLDRRLGFDVAVYNSTSYDQIFTTDVTGATGRRRDVVNAGEIENKGIEMTLRATPIKTPEFQWNITMNWARNRNKVVSLYEGATNLQLSTAQGGISLNATVGEPFGTIRGTNYVYDEQGRPIVYPHWNGGVRFRKTAAPEVIGDINPDWTGGIQNNLTYKGVTLSFLIDMQKGGDFFSLDTWYGYATGIYDITAGTNADGNPRRDLPGDGGGIYLSELDYLDFSETVMHATDGSGGYVYDADGNPVGGDVNTETFYVSDVYNSLGYVYAPNAFHVYDASFVKLREVSVTYSLPKTLISSTPFQSIDVSLIGRNLWIIHKNSPYSDPEAGLSAGNNLGNQSGAYPAVKEYGFNIGLKF